MGRRLVSLLSAAICLLFGLLVPTSTSAATDGSYVGLTPDRVLDTRDGTALGARETRDLKVTGVGGVPASGVGAVALNVTVTGSSSPTYVTVFPAGTERPTASNVNVAFPGDTVANLVVADVGEGGMVSMFNGLGTADVIVDVAGWFPDGGDFTGVVPSRALDTREVGGAFGAGESRDLKLTGAAGVPADGVGGVVMNITLTGNTAGTFLKAFPADGPVPDTSSVNIAGSGDSRANLVIAELSADGKVRLANGPASTEVLVDVAGWFPTGGTFNAVAPTRLLDTRQAGGQLAAKEVRSLKVTGTAGVPAEGVGAVVVNVTAASAVAPTFVSVFPSGGAKPEASNVNVGSPGGTVANAVIASVGADGTVSIANGPGATDVIVDVVGWFPGSSNPEPPPSGSELGVLYGTWSEGGYGEGRISKFDLDAPTDEWDLVNTGQGNHIDIADDARLIAAGDSCIQCSLDVRIFDLDTQIVDETFSWPEVPDNGDGFEFVDLSISDDGQYVAAVIENIYSDVNWLSVYHRASKTVAEGWFMVDDFDDSGVSAMAWAPDGDLVFGAGLAEVGEPDRWSTIGFIDRADLRAEDLLEVSQGLKFFTRAEAEYPPTWLDVSPDLDRIAYVQRADLWTMAFKPGGATKQLTTGPIGILSARYSPDGTELAVSGRTSRYEIASQYILPTDSSQPININGDEDRYLVTSRKLVDYIEAWLDE